MPQYSAQDQRRVPLMRYIAGRVPQPRRDGPVMQEWVGVDEARGLHINTMFCMRCSTRRCREDYVPALCPEDGWAGVLPRGLLSVE